MQDYTDNPRDLKRAVHDLQIGGGTSIYDAIYLACKEKLAQEAGRKAIILISDGEDTTSKVKFNEALDFGSSERRRHLCHFEQRQRILFIRAEAVAAAAEFMVAAISAL